MGKKEEGAELEGLIAEDGSHPVDKGLTLVEYSRRVPAEIFNADMAPRRFYVRADRKTVPKQDQISQDRKRGAVAVLEKPKKKSAVSTTGRKKGERRK